MPTQRERTIVIIQARRIHPRLPGKVLMLTDIVQLWRDKPELFEPNRELAEQRGVALCQV